MSGRIVKLLRFLTGNGMVLVLVLLCLVFSVLTLNEQQLTGTAAAEQVAADIRALGSGKSVLIVASSTQADAEFAERLRTLLTEAGMTVEVAQGEPRAARLELERIAKSGKSLDAIACTETTFSWLVVTDVAEDFPTLAGARVVTLHSYWWPNFLKRDNLLNIANQIAVIAIVAIGMTIVIITGGIDLSVGSLIALAAVVSTLLIQHVFGARQATSAGMVLACLAGIAASGLIGAFSGVMITAFRVPPFIVTLAVMLVASGYALRLTDGESVYAVPDSFVWLGRDSDLLGLPNAVLLMVILYAAAHVLMARTILGRYLYAVGGNAEAARLSGVPVQRVLLFAYVFSGLMAGLGGIIMASQLKSGSPNYGGGYELAVIAAVVVGGTSLSGGEGRMSGTLIGAFIIAVIQNGMNLTNINPFTQKIVLGLVILAAILFDQFKQRWWAPRAEPKRA
ncbi:MAG: ABC transporter permease [Gemmataceae bacterium]|nr:ABC transporter permease [Gemmataceae bacterium]